MIAKLRGIVDGLGEDYAVIDVGGVGYLVFASNRTLSKLTRGTEVSLWIETVVREDSISLYGFFHPLEKEWFLTADKSTGRGGKSLSQHFVGAFAVAAGSGGCPPGQGIFCAGKRGRAEAGGTDRQRTEGQDGRLAAGGRHRGTGGGDGA